MLQVVEATGSLAVAATAPPAAGVAWWAHVVGFLFGVAAVRAFARSPRLERFEP